MATKLESHISSEAQHRDRWLSLARLAWMVVAVLAIGVFFTSLPVRFRELHEICTAARAVCEREQRLTPGMVQDLEALGLSVEVFATSITVVVVISVLASAIVGFLIFTRKQNDGLALLAALAVVTIGSVFNTEVNTLIRWFPAWWLPSKVQAIIAFTSIILFLFLFPSGSFVPRWTVWFALAWIVGDIFSVFSDLLPAWYEPIGFALFLIPALCSIGSQIYRYQRVSDPIQQRQTRWVVFGITTGLGGVIVIALFDIVSSELIQQQSGSLLLFFTPVPMMAIPLTIGIAILRYRLYDIDVIIRRTLVYTCLTVSLGLVYVSCVLLLRALIAPVLNGSDLAIVASTLAIAALFSPLRRWIQNLINRRFYRRAYDATIVMAAFGSTVRDEISLERLTIELLRVVNETMQPVFVSLWMPGEEPPLV